MSTSPLTFSESWHRVANQKISLQPGVKVSRQNFRGERWIVLENSFSNQYFRIRPAAYEFVARLRPDRTVQEVWEETLNRFPDDAPGQEAVIQLLSQLYLANLLQYSVAADTAQLFKRYERTRQREMRAKLLNVMFMRFPLFDPDQFLVRTMPIVRKIISPIGALVWLAVIIAAGKVAIDNWPTLRQQTEGVLAPDNLFFLYISTVLIKGLHEFGHAYFCRRFGGEVHVMGIMLMIFTPMPYVDATSSWGFRSRWKRILVGAAGMIVELFIAALAVFVWAKTAPGTLHSVAYNIIFVASVSTVIFNINPLLRYDGYYILSDLLEIPNLNQRALQYLKYLAERYLFGLKKAENPAHTSREKAWLGSYGVLSNIYRIFIFSHILLFVADRFLLIGIVMAAVCAISWVFVPIVRLIKYLALSPSLVRHRLRAVGVTVAIVAGLLVLLDVIPFPHHFRAPGVLRSRERIEVATDVQGNLMKVFVTSGTMVTRGQELAQLDNKELGLQLVSARGNQTELEARLREAMQNKIANLMPLSKALEASTQRVRRLEADQAALVIRAGQDGIWVAPDVKDYVGRHLPRGTPLGLLIDPSQFEFVATVRQEDADSLFRRKILGMEAKLFGESKKVMELQQLRIVPAEQQNLPSPALGWLAGGEMAVAKDDPHGVRAAEPFFEVGAVVKTAGDTALFHGRAGKMRFKLESEPLLPRWIRRLRQLLQKRYAL